MEMVKVQNPHKESLKSKGKKLESPGIIYGDQTPSHTGCASSKRVLIPNRAQDARQVEDLDRKWCSHRRQVGGAQQGKHNCATRRVVVARVHLTVVRRVGVMRPSKRRVFESKPHYSFCKTATAPLPAAMEESGETRLPELPRPPELPMEFLSRSWTASSLEASKALAPPPPPLPPFLPTAAIPEDVAGEVEETGAPASTVIGNPFSFASSATSQLVMERIMSQSEVSPLTSGRLSHSSGPLNGGGSLSDSPPVSPSDMDDVKYCATGGNALKPQPYRGTSKTVGRWLKDRKEKKKEETRAHNAQLHAVISVAGVAAAIAAIAAATAGASGSGKDDRAARTDMAVASAATLVAAQCVEAAESMGAEREQLASVVSSAVNVRTPGDIVTLTAAAATALRGAATLKARALKEVWNIAAVIPVERSAVANHHNHRHCKQDKELDNNGSSFADEFVPEENFLGLCSQELLARGTELLKRTRKGALHWKVVSVYINKMGQVMLKMKSKHVAGTFTKKKKNVIVDVCKDIQAWPGRHLLEGGELRRYFGLRTAEQRVIEFECRSLREYDMWTRGVYRLLNIVNDKKHLS
ncbi:VAN3-binding protein-like [Zingiber officinale]|uniref:VAN3-binding protein-like n=1 Tax=Zingiber officinale TaxID=94328 RepID=UPI001C4DA210|nr:VAN3-binding protein-like [Zingiber officinale]